MTATEKLRRLLDERGTEHTDLGGFTEWTNGCGRICRAYTRPEPLTVDIAMLAVPPEQAIAATLGGGKCENVAPDYLDFLCSDCGFVHYHSDENDTGDGNDWAYCPRCGKAVKR